MNWKAMANPNGLVPMTIIKAFAPYKANSVAGFSPDLAQLYYEKGWALPQGTAPPVKGQRNGPAARAVEPMTTVDGVHQIPVDILKRHHLQRIKVARDLLGDSYPKSQQESGMTPTDYADKVIAEELARRSGGIKDLDEQ